jgi:ketosteroid isomerase-like protein
MNTLLLAMLWPLLSASMQEPDLERIREVIREQQRDWNRGDLESFMKGYEKGQRLVFTSSGKIRRGWNEALARYRESYPDRETMGQLEFSDLEITLLGESAAVVLGRWALKRKQDNPRGVFTLVLRKATDGWKIIHDHTSSTP